MQENIEQQNIYTVSRLNNEVRFLLEDTYDSVWVEGEISNFAAPHSGHWYFSLKDPSAQIRCAMFKGQQKRLGFTPKDGMHVLIKARASLYENRGEFQLIAEFMEERGEGKLRRAYEILKKKLEDAGLFDPAHKKALPTFPTQIGVVTSATGAAIRDILHVLKRRAPFVPVIIYPTLVQGSTAAPAIVKAIQTANQRAECDVLIVARGGGSLEDLWPFNEEIVAKAIYASEIPIISGVGHEVDFTIADFVADVRAPTPSAAAEIATPDQAELLALLRRYYALITRCVKRHISHSVQQVEWTQKHLAQQHPRRRLAEKMQLLDFNESALVAAQHKLLNRYQTQLTHLTHRLERKTPAQLLTAIQNQLAFYQEKLRNSTAQYIAKQQAELGEVAAKLDGLSPLATLGRGYAIATDQSNHLVQDAAQVKVGDKLKLRLAKGRLDCLVEDTTLI